MKHVWIVIHGKSEKGYFVVRREAYSTYQKANAIALVAIGKKLDNDVETQIIDDVVIFRAGMDYVKIVRLEVM